MITASKNIVPDVTVAINDIQKAKDSLRKVSSETSNYDTRNLATTPEKEGVDRTLALIPINGDLDETISHIKKNGFNIVESRMVHLSLDEAKKFYMDHQSQSYYDKMIRWLSCGSGICALILEKQDAIKDWKYLMGPANYKKARKTNPNSIRALFGGKDASQNATHGSDSDASAKKEIDFIFGSAAQKNIASPNDAAQEVAQLQQEQHQNQEQSQDSTISQKNPEISIENIAFISNDEIITDINETSTSYHNNSDSVTQNNNTNKSLDIVAHLSTEEKSVNGKNVASLDDKKTVKNDSDVSQTQLIIIEKEDNTVTKSTNPTEEKIVSNNTTTPKDAITKDDATINIIKESLVEALPPIGEDTHHDTAENVAQMEAAPELQDDLTGNSAVLPENKATFEKTAENDITRREEVISSTPCLEEKVDIDTKVDDTEPFTEIQDQDQRNSGAVPAEEKLPKKASGNETAQQEEDISSLSSTTVESVIDTAKEEANTEEKEISFIIPADTENQIEPPGNDITLLEGTDEKSIRKEPDEKPEKKNDIVNKKVLSTTKKENEDKVKKNGALGSNSRIKPPSIKREKYNATHVKSADLPSTGRVASKAITINGKKANTTSATAGATRIARLSPSAIINSDTSCSSDAVKDKKLTLNTTVATRKVTTTKVSKNLPRVAMIPSQKQQTPPKKEEEDDKQEKKAKKRLSSSKSFISRLTAPTVASANKKSDSEIAASTTSTGAVSRRATLPSKRASTVNPSMSNSSSKIPPAAARTKHKKEESAAIHSQSQQSKKEEVAATDVSENISNKNVADAEKISG